jgi:hypothetical protein
MRKTNVKKQKESTAGANPHNPGSIKSNRQIAKEAKRAKFKNIDKFSCGVIFEQGCVTKTQYCIQKPTKEKLLESQKKHARKHSEKVVTFTKITSL